MSIANEIQRLQSAKADIKAAIENKGVTVGDIGIQEYASKIDEMKVATPPTKGFIINEFDSNGYATEVSIVGMTSLPAYAFATYSTNYLNLFTKYLKKVNLPDGLTTINNYCFYVNNSLTTINLPDTLTSIGNNAFSSCSKLIINELPVNITIINSYCFSSCSAITEMTCKGKITKIDSTAFYRCYSLSKFVLPNITSVPTLGSSVFSSTEIASGTGYIYVPDNLVESFKTATNWSTYANQIKGVSEL
jgi:hypothetical protein